MHCDMRKSEHQGRANKEWATIEMVEREKEESTSYKCAML